LGRDRLRRAGLPPPILPPRARRAGTVGGGRAALRLGPASDVDLWRVHDHRALASPSGRTYDGSRRDTLKERSLRLWSHGKARRLRSEGRRAPQGDGAGCGAISAPFGTAVPAVCHATAVAGLGTARRRDALNLVERWKSGKLW